jgi:hypothetical protein
VGEIDRKKHVADVMERVLGVENDTAPHTEVIDLGVRSWLGGTVSSAVQLSIGDRQFERTRGRESSSDRDDDR